MSKTKQIEVWVAIDDAGYVGLAQTRGDAVYDLPGDSGREHRTVKIVLTVPVPEVVTLTADLTGSEPVSLVAAQVQ